MRQEWRVGQRTRSTSYCTQFTGTDFVYVHKCIHPYYLVSDDIFIRAPSKGPMNPRQQMWSVVFTSAVQHTGPSPERRSRTGLDAECPLLPPAPPWDLRLDLHLFCWGGLDPNYSGGP